MSTKASDREKRRATALRQNLKRRKAAVRLRDGAEPAAPPDTVLGASELRPNKAQKSD